MEKNKIVEYLKNNFPDARTGFIEALVNALELHSRKNSDYTGASITPLIFSDFETTSKFCDIRRKYSRLYHFIAEKNKLKVNETVEDTAIDLLVYAGLFVEYLHSQKMGDTVGFATTPIS